MNIKEALAFGRKNLKKTKPRSEGRRGNIRPNHRVRPSATGVKDGQFDALVLLCAAIKKPKEFIYAHPEKKLTSAQIKKYKNFISRRAKREPAAYITGKKEFYGFEFFVNKNVLIPRPDTEILIELTRGTLAELCKGLCKGPPCKIIDIGTGSGAIAITLKKLFPRARVFASDINPKSLALAKKNARRLRANIIFKKGNLLAPFLRCSPSSCSGTDSYCLSGAERSRRPTLAITANLPYLSRAEWQKCQPEIKKYEPYGALVGGKTGTEIYKKLFKQIYEIHETTTPLPSYRPTILFIEIGHKQKPIITRLAKKILKPQKIEFHKDLSGRPRVAEIML